MNFSIGLSGLQVAQRTIELIGTNISNVATEGYHRQDAIIEPYSTGGSDFSPVGGAKIARYRRAVDTLLESEILGQQPQLNQMSLEVRTLQGVQSAFGDLDADGLTAELNKFFGALRELAADPTSQALREQAAWSASSLAASFRHVGGVLEDLKDELFQQSKVLVEQVNSLTDEIARLNGDIRATVPRGGNANLLLDRRDQAILELSELVELETFDDPEGTGAVNVVVWGTPVVTTDFSHALEAGTAANGDIGVAPEGASRYDTDVRGGKLGGAIGLRNELLDEIQAELDNVATQLMSEINKLHVQGVGATGSFDQLTGVAVTDTGAALGTWDTPITSGTLHVRLISPAGAVTRYAVQVDADNDTLDTMATKLNALAPSSFSASVVGGALHLEGKAGYEFDFLPTPELRVGPVWTGTSAPTESGSYTGGGDETYTFTVVGSGTVGTDPGLAVEVRDRAGALVATLDIGNTYVPGTPLAVEEGLSVAFAAGTVTDTEQFTIEALAAPAGPSFEMSSPWNGTSTPAVSGIYTGAANDTFTFTVTGGGQVGTDADVVVEVRNGAGELVTTLDIGSGYAAGDPLLVCDGVYATFGTGAVEAGEQFAVEALGASDPTGFLAAAGINTLFEGMGASTLAVRDEILNDPRRLATAAGAEMADNAAVRAMADVSEKKLAALDDVTVSDGFRLLVSGVGQRIAIRDARLTALNSVVEQLVNQREQVSGVDLNEEAAKLLVFQKMFQGMAKFMGAQKETLDALIDLI